MAASTNEQEHGDNITLEAVISDLRRYTGLMLIVFVAVAALVFAVTYFKTPKYTATSSVLISNEAQVALPGQQDNGQQADTATVDSEVELLRSNAVAVRVVKQLKLQNDPAYNGTASAEKFSIRKLIGGAKKSAVAAKPDVDPVVQTAADALLENIDVKRVGLTRLIKINYTSTSKGRSAEVANAWAQSYLDEKIAVREAANQQASGWLNERLTTLRQQVDESARAVQEYKIQNNLMSATGSTLTEQEISDLNRQLASAQVDRAESAARLNTARNQMAAGSSGDDVGEALGSSVVSNLRTQAATISSHLAELQSHYGPMHPEVIKAKNQLADINSQIQAEIRRIMSNLDAQDKIQQQRAGSLVGAVRRAQGQLASNSKASVKLNELELNAESVRQLYESYLDRMKQTSTQSGLQTSNATVASRAQTPQAPSSPKLALSLMLAVVAGAFSAGSSVLVRRALDSGLMTSKDIEDALGINYLASIADVSSTLKKSETSKVPYLYLAERPLSVFAEGFRNMRAAILYSPNKVPKVIAVTSALPGEGKTTTSVCLATAFSLAGNSVVVVDCDLRKRSLNAIFKQSPEKGLVEAVMGEVSLAQVIQQDEATKVHYVPLSVHPVTSQDIFSNPKFDALLDLLREQFDYVILDTAPILPVADTRILARKADYVALLIRWRKTPKRAVQAAVDILEGARVEINGAALTQVDVVAQGKYGYGDAGYYYKDYKSYYVQN
ncbi:GumC family protein [Asticcacaulis benevestitus]|uniref:non-specific protein-tyrosine kinase n=1 Tax=Asticcacaulis benevestitus DSM 16100 = ATCC BAA-896 TaxID=1121022 RepID=V4PMG7_9CAUL|nr:polysaccharide biosynthesis tyrosine autokinase [Asticcacaulis benevestitus]ESQ89451.1 hypothetical protein ABENE_13815 [Asticcacaulis benevestitus DSM 16100 = ATCC BAA-896]